MKKYVNQILSQTCPKARSKSQSDPKNQQPHWLIEINIDEIAEPKDNHVDDDDSDGDKNEPRMKKKNG